MKRTFLALVWLLGLSAALEPAYADCVLRQSTASQVVQLPRFVDSTDGVTPETALTIANTDIKLGKAGSTTQANKNSGGATHIATGDYYTTLDATDTNTVGNLHIVIGVSGALPVWVDCIVLEEAVYDADYAASATGKRDANVTQFNGSNATSASGRPEVNTTHANGTALAPSSCTGAIPSLGIIDCGTAQAVTSTTLQLRSAANFDADSEIVGATCVIGTATTGAGQSRTVSAYTNSTDTATVSAWTTTPTGTITYFCFGTSAGSAAAVWDEALASHTTSGTAGERLGRIPNVAAAASGGLPTVDANNAVKLQSGTGANQIDLSSGQVRLQPTQTGTTIPTVTTVTNVTNAPTSGDLTATMKTSVATAVQTGQGLLAGTCSSGSTTTCVDAARTEANASQIQDRMICFSDGFCALITTFNPATDTSTTTKVAPSTRSSLTYIIFPSTAS